MINEPYEKLRLTKREFVKLCCAGFGSCLMGSPNLEALIERSGAGRSLQAEGGPGKWSRVARYYVATGDGLKCLKCPHACVLGSDQVGRCRNRINYEGKMYTLAYGNPCAVHIDPIEKKPLFHFLPSTRAFSIAVAGCNLRCLNCQNWEISQMSPTETKNIDLPPEGVVDQARATGCASIAFTYSEPTTFFEYAFDTAVFARKQNIRSVWKSSGYINEEPLRALCKVIDAANIDLKGFDDKIYWELNGAGLGPVLRTLKILKNEGVWLEITNLVIPTWTDNLEVIRRMCDWLCENGLKDSPLHFSRFTPLYKLAELPQTPVSTLERAREDALKSGMRFVYIGNVPAHPAENTSCPRCGKTILERRGYVILQNDIVKGSCKFCGESIPGVWS